MRSKLIRQVFNRKPSAGVYSQFIENIKPAAGLNLRSRLISWQVIMAGPLPSLGRLFGLRPIVIRSPIDFLLLLFERSERSDVAAPRSARKEKANRLNAVVLLKAAGGSLLLIY